jgi:hypothetical protein
MASNLLGVRVDEILDHVFGENPEATLVVNPPATVVETLIESATEYEGDLPEIRVLANESTLKTVMADFIVASNAADLIEAGSLSLRTTDDLPQGSLVLTPDRAIALVAVDDQTGGLSAEDDPFVETAFDAYNADWEDAEQFNLRTPAISRVRDTLETEISPEVEDDFDAVLASLETARGDGEGLDEVTISLLVAAKNRVLLYDISKWGEDVGIASKATFSRTKTKLEDMGLIDTEKVPIDVGRPRLRLRLADDRLEDADPAEMANVAQSVLG